MMEANNKEELFSIRLKTEGISNLLRYSKLIKIYLFSGLAWSILSLIDNAIIISKIKSINRSSFFDFYNTIYPFLYIIITIIYGFQLYIYYKLRVVLLKAIRQMDENLLDLSFSYLTKSIIITTILNVISVLLYVINITITVRNHS